MLDPNQSAALIQGPSGPHEYAAAGFRIIPCKSDGTKKPLVGGFGKDDPAFTIAPDNFAPEDLVGILTGPCPALGDDWLAVLDLDGETTLDQVNDHVGGEPLPTTLSSKGYRHFYFRVPPGPKRDRIKQWVRCLGRGKGQPEIDLKWSGGFACEPEGAWDVPFNADAIATLPEAWIDSLLVLHPPGGPTAPRPPRREQAMGEVPSVALKALASVWPKAGEGCHDAALALGGILHDHSWWDEEDVAAFAGALFNATGTTDRVSDVLYSYQNKRDGAESGVYGWPTLRELCTQAGISARRFDEVCKVLKDQIPGMRELKVDLSAGLLDDGRRQGKADLKLNIGSDDEIAGCILRDHLQGAVFDLGEVWQFDLDSGLWKVVDDHKLHPWVTAFDGVVYDFTDKGRPIWVKLNAQRHASIKKTLCFKLEADDFFAQRPRGIAFRNGFLSIPEGTFGPLTKDHRVRVALPVDYIKGEGPPPAPAWDAFVESVWGADPDDEDGARDDQSIQLVHELLGAIFANDLRAQKCAVLIGPPRAGKGTIFNLIADVLGLSVASFKVQALGDKFELEGLVRRTVAVDPDVKFSEMRNADRIVERLLSISSNDHQMVPRKNKTAWQGQLGVFPLLGINPGAFKLDNAVLASRFILLPFTRSFLHKEDPKLGEKLRAEIPGIVARAVVAYRDFEARGCKFIEPKSAVETRGDLDVMSGFITARCELGPWSQGYTAHPDLVWTMARDWASNSQKQLKQADYRNALEQRQVKRAIAPRTYADETGKRPWWLFGLRLKP